jgi:hypothetical protein
VLRSMQVLVEKVVWSSPAFQVSV